MGVFTHSLCGYPAYVTPLAWTNGRRRSWWPHSWWCRTDAVNLPVGSAHFEDTLTTKMIGNLRPASDADIERLLANPADITRFLYGAQAEERERVVLDKAWHAIHYALTGSRLGGDEPLNFLVSEGTPVGEVDVGYGPARVLTSDQVRSIANALAPIPPEDVARRVDPRQLDEEVIYPGNWQRNGYGVDFIASNYRDMRDLIARLAEQGLGLVLYIN